MCEGTTAKSRSVAGVWAKQLITKDDPIHVHKTLGILCLLSFIWRLSLWRPLSNVSDLGFDSYPSLTLPTVALHFLLNASSFEFKLPPRRISSGYRIWPEYRLHSLVFLCRSLATILLFYFEKLYSLEPRHEMTLLIVLATMAAADTSSRMTDHKSGFSRQLKAPPLTRFFFSTAQLWATAGIIVGARSCSIQFIYAFIIQVNAFLMTLQRKNLAGHYFLVSMYGLMLAVGIGICTTELLRKDGMKGWFMFQLAGNAAALIRLNRHTPAVLNNKYLIWVFVAGMVALLRENLDNLGMSNVMIAAGVSHVGLVGLGYYNHRYPRERDAAASAKKE